MSLMKWLGFSRDDDKTMQEKQLQMSRKEREALERRLRLLQSEVDVLIREGNRAT